MAKQKTEAQIDRYSRFGAPGQWAAAFTVGTISASSTFINLVRTKFHEDNSFRQGFAVLHEAKNLKLQQMNDDQILASLDILKKYVGEHPSYQEFVDAREALNKYGKNALQLDKTYDIEEALQRYTKASEVFEKQCREGIDRAMLSKEYKNLAINSSQKQSTLKMRFDKLYDGFAETIYGIKSKGIIGHTQGVWERFVGFGGYTKRNMLFKTAVAFGVAFGGTMMVFNQLNTRDKLNEIDKQSESADRKLDALLAKADIGEHEIETRAEHRAHVREKEKAEDRALKAKGRHVSKVKESRLEAETSDDHATVDADEQHAHLGSHTRALAESRAEASQELAV